jgi:type VI secretion system protein ImpA
MALPESLLEPISGDNPAGQDLYYDNLFSQIKEARREDEDDLPEGAWERSKKKKADYRSVIKLAGDALEKRSKDMRLAGWLVEAYLRIEGFPVLLPSIQLLKALQETFWDNLYPAIEEGNDLEMRAVSVEGAGSLIAAAVRKLPLTRSGLSFEKYLEAKAVGYEKDATNRDLTAARNDAIERGKLTAEDFDSAFAASPKSLYADADRILTAAMEAVEDLDRYGDRVYGDNSPNLGKLKTSLGDVQLVVTQLLNERRKTEPDPVAVTDEPEEETGEAAGEGSAGAEGEPVGASTRRSRPKSGDLGSLDDAYAQVVESAEFLSARNPQSPVPYLICSGLRLGETLMQESTPAPGFAVGPLPEVRQRLRVLAAKGDWRELLGASLPILASECARAWLDLHRYIWRAGQETGAEAISAAVVGTVKSLLTARPELRYWTLEDDTGAANPETQQWLDSTVLQ